MIFVKIPQNFIKSPLKSCLYAIKHFVCLLLSACPYFFTADPKVSLNILWRFPGNSLFDFIVSETLFNVLDKVCISFGARENSAPDDELPDENLCFFFSLTPLVVYAFVTQE